MCPIAPLCYCIDSTACPGLDLYETDCQSDADCCQGVCHFDGIGALYASACKYLSRIAPQEHGGQERTNLDGHTAASADSLSRLAVRFLATCLTQLWLLAHKAHVRSVSTYCGATAQCEVLQSHSVGESLIPPGKLWSTDNLFKPNKHLCMHCNNSD